MSAENGSAEIVMAPAQIAESSLFFSFIIVTTFLSIGVTYFIALSGEKSIANLAIDQNKDRKRGGGGYERSDGCIL